MGAVGLAFEKNLFTGPVSSCMFLKKWELHFGSFIGSIFSRYSTWYCVNYFVTIAESQNT